MARREKKTKPTTVRFEPELDSFVKAMADRHPDGQSGVINDAVKYYKRHVDQNKNKEVQFHEAINGVRVGTKRTHRSIAS